VIEAFFQKHDFELERLSYLDENGILKISLVARKGQGQGGIGFFSHSDTVPGAEDAWAAFQPVVKEGKLYGRGSCDMKGPLAATMLAAAQTDARQLQKPVYVVVTADEENGFGGAKQVADASEIFKRYGWPDLGIVAEPSELIPIYAHKGGHFVSVTAHGKAAHTSTEKGVSANFLLAPFLAEMAELKKAFMSDRQYMNDEFSPPTNGFNMTLNDGNCAANVTAAKTICTLNFRAMPGVDNAGIVRQISERAQHYGFETTTRGFAAFYVNPDAEVVKLALEVTGEPKAITVPYGTEALVYQQHLPLVILGPGNIAQAHTVDEWIELGQLERAVAIYEQLIEKHCQAYK
jgi:acetylornithine deacetylase